MHLPAAIDFLLCSFDTDTDTFDAPLTLLSLSVHLTEAVSSGLKTTNYNLLQYGTQMLLNLVCQPELILV